MIYTILFTFIGLFIIYLFLICPNLSRQDRMKTYHGSIFAHRGCHNNKNGIPENSMPAFVIALQRNLPIELDVHLTKDQKIVVFHDDNLSRMCGLDGIIEDMNYDEIKKLSLLKTGCTIPLLEDVLKLVDGKVLLLIELKLPYPDTSACAFTYRILQNYSGDYMIQSFNSLGLLWFKRNAPTVLRGQLSSNLRKSNKSNPFLLCFMIRFLLTNCLCKPDFISYKLADTKNYSLFLNQFFYKVPIAIWTVRTEKDFQYSKKNYNMVIFESIRK